jgi:hypothetical protein
MVKINLATIRGMANRRLVIATVLAGVALAIAVLGMIGENSISGMQTGMSGHASLAATHFAGLSASHVPGLIALALSAAAFIVSWGQRSYLVAGLLIAAGIIYTVHLAPFLGDHSIIAFPGPVVGLFFGHVILGLGVATGIGSARTRMVQTPN